MSILLFAAMLVFAVGESMGDTPAPHACTTRFEYEYRVLQKLLLSQINQKHFQNGLVQLGKRFNRLAKQLEDVLNAQRHTAGSVYTRWGRTTCPVGTELVYQGYAAGRHYTHKGGAVNPLCLPKNPDDGQHSTLKDKHYGYIYGAEYEVQNGAFFPGGKSHFQQDVPCTVCRSPRATVVMVPGKNQCQSGWNLEYTGYLMSGHYNHPTASQYSCVDGAPESVTGGIKNHDGYLFYMVAAKCGSLKCPPYVEGQVLVCAVCSK